MYKLRDTTLLKDVTELGKENFDKGQLDVELNRLKTSERIASSHLDANKLLNRPHDQITLLEIAKSHFFL